MSVLPLLTVTAAASSYDLVTLAAVKAELAITVSTYDSILGTYISAASAAAAQYCNRVFPKETLTEIFNLSRARLQWGGERLLQAGRYPVVTVASVTEDTTVLVANTDYKVDLVTGQFFRLEPTSGIVTRWDITPVTIVYDAGYNTIPLDLADAVTRMVKSRWFARGRDPYTRQENIPGVRDVSYWVPTGTEAGNLTPDIADILDNYRAVTFG